MNFRERHDMKYIIGIAAALVLVGLLYYVLT